MTDNPLRILSLDGGGVRGISSLYILKELMRQLAREYQADNPNAPELTPRPCEYFNLICGTSTGGLIARKSDSQGSSSRRMRFGHQS